MKSKIVSSLIIIITFGVALARMANCSKKVILHWDISGNLTSQGTENLIILLPMISVIIFAIFKYYERNPYKLSTLPRIEESESNTKMLVKHIKTMAMLTLLAMLYITMCSAKMADIRLLIIVPFLLLTMGYYAHTRKKIKAGFCAQAK